MEKRLFIVIPLCLLILIGYQALFVKRAPPAPLQPAPSVVEPSSASSSSTDATKPNDAEPAAQDASGEPSLPRVADTEERTKELVVGRPGEPGYYRAVFTNKGGGLLELRTGNAFVRAGLDETQKKDPKYWEPLVGHTAENAKLRPASFALRTQENSASLQRAPLDEELWTMKVLGDEQASGGARGVEFTLSPGTGVTFTKRILFVPGRDELKLELELANDALASQSGPRVFQLTPAAWLDAQSGDGYYPEPQATAAGRKHGSEDLECVSIPRDEGGSEPRRGTLRANEDLAFVGVHGKYFAFLLFPEEASRKALLGADWRKQYDSDWAAAHPEHADRAWKQIVSDALVELPLSAMGGTSKVAFRAYAGKKEPEALRAAHPDLEALHRYDLGWVRVISAPLLLLLKLFHSLVSSWGVAIVLLTLLVRLVLFPINRRSQTAMARYTAKMKRLQPRIDELKKRYEKDPSKLRTEQARLMQQEGAFPPLGGCLPMFLQIPVFIGLYRALGISYDLRQQPFLGWIHDLALPDRTLPLNWHLPLFGDVPYLNVLPPVMVVLWVWQQRMMPAPADEQAAKMQKMMMFMPVMMGVFLYNYAAGLSLYMITQSALGIFETKVIRKYWPVDDKELAPKKSGFWARMMALQEEAERKKRAGRAR